MTWLESVIQAIQDLTARKDSRMFSRSELINEELENITRRLPAVGKTPEQTLSRVLQQLRDEGYLIFTRRGEYVFVPDREQADEIENMKSTRDEIFNYETGIENEDSEQDQLTDPFDPEEISIDTKLVSMETCLRRLTQGTIVLNPDFQRKEVWTYDKKSQLIESLMLKIPLPMFYVSADEKSNYTVVDGLQRLSTIRSFILGDLYLNTIDKFGNRDEGIRGKGFKLQNLEFWNDFEGKNFNELPINIRNRILETEFRFTVINPGTPEEVRRNIFKRLNTGGMPLSSQEIRNALYLGKATELLNDLSENTVFREATGYSIQSLRMEDKELILRYVAFLLRDYTTYKRTITIDTFLSDTMIILNAMPDFNTREFQKLNRKGNVNISDINMMSIDDIKRYFHVAMKRAYEIFDKHTFRKSYGNNRRTPINKALFETWGVIMTRLSQEEFDRLNENKAAFLDEYSEVLDDPMFQIYISRDSMKNYAVKERFEKLNNIVQNHLI